MWLAPRVRAYHVLFARQRDDDSGVAVLDELMGSAEALAAEMGLQPRTIVRQSDSIGETLVRVAAAEQADLVVLGARVRNVDGRPFIGHTAETVLDECDATVVLVARPR